MINPAPDLIITLPLVEDKEFDLAKHIGKIFLCCLRDEIEEYNKRREEEIINGTGTGSPIGIIRLPKQKENQR